MHIPQTVKNAVRSLRRATASKDKIAYFDILYQLSPIDWLLQARECDPSFVEHIAELGQPNSIKNFTEGSQVSVPLHFATKLDLAPKI